MFFTRRSLIKTTILSLLSTGTLAKAGAALPLVVKIIGNPSDSAFALSVTPQSTSRVYVEYGYKATLLESKTSVITIQKNVTSTIVVNGLKSKSKIFYRVRYAALSAKNFSALSVRNIVTSSEATTSTFAIQADPHMDENSSADVYRGTLKQIVAASPAFLMDLGDIFMVDKLQDKSEKNIRARFELMKGFYQELGTVPLKICLGNHDGELGYSKFNTKRYRKEYFPEETGELAYYSFTGPDQLHVVLDPFTYTTKNPSPDGWEWTLGKTQYDWLVSTLSNSIEQHKFIYIHHLLVGDQTSRGGVEIAKYNEWGGSNKDGSYGFDSNRPGWAKPIHQLLVDNKVGFVFKGHDHLYVKQELDGIIYQTLPQPSHPGDKLNVAQYGYLSGKGVGGSGFLKVSTTGDSAQVDFVLFDGKIADSYSRKVNS